jgi:hypothetical protein
MAKDGAYDDYQAERSNEANPIPEGSLAGIDPNSAGCDERDGHGWSEQVHRMWDLPVRACSQIKNAARSAAGG